MQLTLNAARSGFAQANVDLKKARTAGNKTAERIALQNMAVWAKIIEFMLNGSIQQASGIAGTIQTAVNNAVTTGAVTGNDTKSFYSSLLPYLAVSVALLLFIKLR